MSKLSKNQLLENQLKRTLADYQNLQKRIVSDQVEFVKFANASLISKLLPILDDLKRAAAHLNDQGLHLTLAHFQTVLESEGIKELKLLSTIFDPKTAEVIELVSGKKDHIIEIVQAGYTHHDRVLRPARVKVGKGD
ncbi:MAG: nucleotide exchange factor GrpE [Candidatus Beckwithbacteria bacterium]